MKPNKKSVTLSSSPTKSESPAPINKRSDWPRASYNDICRRGLGPKECTAANVRADDAEIATLQIARYFLIAFTSPQSQAWMKAIDAGETLFDLRNGPVIASLTCKVLQAIRRARRSGFAFNTPDCPGCSSILTEHERRMITALIALREQRLERAELELMMLCEGNDTAAVALWMRELALALPVRMAHASRPNNRLN